MSGAPFGKGTTRTGKLLGSLAKIEVGSDDVSTGRDAFD